MKNLVKTAAVTLAALTVLSTTAFAGELPLRATFENAGFTVTWDQATKTVTISKDGFSFSEAVGENITLDYDTTYTTEEFVNSVYEGYTKEAYSTTATVKEIGEGYFLADTEKLGEVMFMVDDNTFYHHEINRMLYTFADLKEGAALKVYFSEAMTASLPPQTYAKEVVFLNTENTEAEAEIIKSETITTSGKITELGEDFFVIEKEDGSSVRFNVGEETNIHHVMNRRFYTFADLEEGMTVDVNHSDAMTYSLPPQAAATEVIIK